MNKIIAWLQARRWKIGAAWIAGTFVYILAAIINGAFDGAPSLICQPFLALIFSGLFVVAAVLLGLFFTLPLFKQLGSPSTRLNLLLIGIGFMLLFFSEPIGFTTEHYNPDINSSLVRPHPIAMTTGYFLIIFSIANWSPKGMDN